MTQKRWCLSTVLHRERRRGGARFTPGAFCTVPVWGIRSKHGDKWQLYLCVLHESIKHWPFKNAPKIFQPVRYRGPNWDAA